MRFSRSFAWRNQHGIGCIAEFEVELEFALEEAAAAVRTLLVLERETAGVGRGRGVPRDGLEGLLAVRGVVGEAFGVVEVHGNNFIGGGDNR
jgi:hypothetical protein